MFSDIYRIEVSAVGDEIAHSVLKAVCKRCWIDGYKTLALKSSTGSIQSQESPESDAGGEVEGEAGG